jgi:hypothetical protein
MKKHLLIFLLVSLSFPLTAQNEVGVLTFTLGGTYGRIKPASTKFQDIYSTPHPIYYGFFGAGNGETFLIGKYKMFSAKGKSEVTNVQIEGTAEWTQTMILGGFRYFPGGSSLFIDAMFFKTTVNEKISTRDPVVSELTGSETIKHTGLAGTLGFSPRLADPLCLHLEIDYSFTFDELKTKSGRSVPNLGGFSYSGGLSIIVN